MNILQAIKDPNLFRPFLGDDLESWRPWLTALRVLYGLPMKDSCRPLVRTCTGRKTRQLPDDGFSTALLLTGRRSGKSRIAAVVAAYEAALAGHETRLAKGERGVVAVCAPTKQQARIVKDYVRAIFDAPLLQGEVVAETRQGFELQNGIRIEILAGDYRTIRGFTLVAAVVDEVAFFGYDAESKVKSDTELVRAIKPSLATVGGKLVAISSPYARRGWSFTTHQKNFGNDAGKILVWNTDSRTMNPTLSQSVVDEAMAEDMQAAKSEYLGEFRDDVALFLPREVIERLVVVDRTDLLPSSTETYYGFADLSGGRSDDAALAIAHKEGRTVIVDLAKRYRPPFNPYSVIALMVDELRRFDLSRVTGDNYAAEFVAQAFEGRGIQYTKCEKPKSALYAELLPRMCSGEIELPDDPVLVTQLASLERRTRSGGKDSIDHPHGGHDDLANAVAGVCDSASARLLVAGAL